MKPLVLFGAGRNSITSYYKFYYKGRIPVCLCDNDSIKVNTKIQFNDVALKVLSLMDVMEHFPDAEFYITPDIPNKLKIIEQLINEGINQYNIINYEEFKKMKSCILIGTSINFTPTQIHHCCSAGNGVKPPVSCDFVGGNFPLDLYKNSVRSLIEANNKENPPCGGCNFFREGCYSILSIPLKSLTINAYMQCNLNCLYCRPQGWAKGQYEWWDMHEMANYDIQETLQDMLEKGIIAQSTYIYWGGGEPVLAKYFNKCCKFLLDKGLAQLVNTNAVIFSETVAKALRTNLLKITISVDSGTSDIYKNVKGSDQYKAVWEHIKKYAEINNENVNIKYIVINENCNSEEFQEFSKQCQLAGVKNIIITPEYNTLWKGSYNDSLLHGIADLYSLLLDRDFFVTVTTDYLNSEQRMKII
jgi:sulfatase maturation enzyme AslB (radical SAM superfamily)